MRSAYLVLTWPLDHDAARARAHELGEHMDRRAPWRRVHSGRCALGWVAGVDAPPVEILPDGGLTIGATFSRSVATISADGARQATAARRLRQLDRERWGGYVAVLSPQGPERAVAYRDPSGGLSCLVWSLPGDLSVVASDFRDLPFDLGPRRPFLNWDRVGAFLAMPAANATASLFDDVQAVGPGELISLDGTSAPTPLWTPTPFVDDPIDDPVYAARELVARVEDCTAGHIRRAGRVIIEMSGGLDSSIVAGAIGARGLAGHVAEGVNVLYGRPESDENAYARAVAALLGVPLHESVRQPRSLEETDFGDLAGELWPTANGVDPSLDLAEIDRLQATRSRAIVSGQGGDALFFQMPSAFVVGDDLAQQGWRALASPVLGAVSRRTRQSVWATLREVHRARGRLPRAHDAGSTLISSGLRAATQDAAHNWEQQAAEADLPLGKQVQIRALTAFHLSLVPSRRSLAAEMIFPLFSQPVLEHCLRIPTPILAGGSYDRAFARDAFASHIPDTVRARRSKGVATVYFAQLIGKSLPVIRPYLLDGCLCDAGVLDRAVLEQVLTRDHLIWSVRPSHILWAVAAEAWVRHWQTRAPDSLTAPRPG